tara:strand:+ start:9675 stop:10766 length:1092 start_codon:yes stop_codon:yes gene_type:complete
MVKDYYKIMGMSESDKKLSDKEFATKLKKQYRSLSKKYHPDMNPGDKEAEEKFKEAAEANETLSDKVKKDNYDKFGHTGQRPTQGGGFGGGMSAEDLMNNFNFGGRSGRNPFGGQREKRGQDILFNMKVTLEDVFNGITKKFKYNRKSACGSCNGAGGANEETCSSCGGNGFVIQQTRTPMGIMNSQTTCHICHGEGKNMKDTCNTCDGRGVDNKEEIISINIPKGISEQESLQYAGMGNAIKGGTPGSLIIKVTISSHKHFTRSGDDIKYHLKLNYSQLVIGDKVEVPTIEGSKIRVTIPEYSKVGDNLRINDKGLNNLRNKSRGAMIIILDIEMPTNVEGEELELVKKLKKLYEGVETKVD